MVIEDNAECKHDWDQSSLVMDFGRYGIRTRHCRICKIIQETDPFSDNNVWTTVEGKKYID